MSETRNEQVEKESPAPAKPRSAEAVDPDAARDEPLDLAGLNRRTARRQHMLLASLGAVILAGAGWYLAGSGSRGDAGKPGDARTIDTAGLVNRDLSQREFVAVYGNRLDAMARAQKELKEAVVPRGEIEQQLAAVRAENQAMQSNGQAAIDAISNENTQLKSQLAATSTSPGAISQPPAYGPQAGGYDQQGRGRDPGAASTDSAQSSGTMPAASEVRLMSFAADRAADGAGATSNGLQITRPDAPPLVVEDSPEYLPPNSYAPARVIVGVDASAGVASQTDPLPVVLRITGPARSVLQDGRVLTTRIAGCVVNGAARGDLSSEKVYVKLARMTCDQPGGRVAVSEVKGFISFAGKSGVRGRVVSREGNLVSQALLAGVIGGFGRGFSANSSSVFSGVTANAGGTTRKLSGGEIIGGGVGQGLADTADTVSKYLIERAEQYQPVVEMPTGIDVEIVFLDGVYVRSPQ